MEPTRQVVRHTTAIGASESPAVLAEMMTYLGYRWHPEYTVYEEYQDFNQEQYRAIVHLYSREYDSTTMLHTAHGVRVTIDMAVHDVAYAALTHLPLQAHCYRIRCWCGGILHYCLVHRHPRALLPSEPGSTC